MLPRYLEKRFILRFEKHHGVSLLPDWPFNRIRRIAKDDLIILAELQKAPDCRQLPPSSYCCQLLRSQLIDKANNINPFNPVWDIPIYPACLQPGNKLPQITHVRLDGQRSGIIAPQGFRIQR